MIKTNPLKDLELSNYLRRLTSILFLIGAVFALIRTIGWGLLRRICPRLVKLIGMPYRIRILRSNLIKSLTKELINNPSVVSDPLYVSDKLDSVKLNLCAGSLIYTDKDSWKSEFSDEEAMCSLHRWRWLLPSLVPGETDIRAEDGLALMNSWVESCLNDDVYGLDAYSTSERAVNGSLFLLNKCGHLGEHRLGPAFKKMGLQIAASLEYYEGELTGNHALNNARGLFFIGVLHNDPDMVALSSEIIYERLPVLVTDDGFLRESSSHYHFLFTRWILEIFWLAEKNELDEVLVFLKPYAYKLVKCCWFYLVRDEESSDWQIPLIGDISPDVPPSWLVSLPWCNLAIEHYKPAVLPKYQGPLGWASTYGITNGDVESSILETLSYPNSFWHRIVKDRLVLFVHAEQSAGVARADHKHADLAGFVLYDRGKLVINDPGRINYTQSEVGLYGKSAAAHNTIFINGLSPEVEGPNWLQKRYISNDVVTKYSLTDSLSVFVVSHNGFDRLGLNKLKHERRFILGADFLRIEDHIGGAEACEVSLRLHLAPHIKLTHFDAESFLLNPSKTVLQIDNRLKVSVKSGDTHPVSGICSSEYGVPGICDTLEMSGFFNLPTVVKTNVSLN